MVEVPTFQATIYVGLQEGYSPGPVHTVDEVIAELRGYTDTEGFCVSVTPVHFVYKGGQEPGVAVGVINYPRFPENNEALIVKALYLARRLGKKFIQVRVSVVFPHETIMLTAGDDY